MILHIFLSSIMEDTPSGSFDLLRGPYGDHITGNTFHIKTELKQHSKCQQWQQLISTESRAAAIVSRSLNMNLLLWHCSKLYIWFFFGLLVRQNKSFGDFSLDRTVRILNSAMMEIAHWSNAQKSRGAERSDNEDFCSRGKSEIMTSSQSLLWEVTPWSLPTVPAICCAEQNFTFCS